MTSVIKDEQQTSSENAQQMEAVFGETYNFTSGDQARDQATTQAELVAAAVAAAANNSNGAGDNYHALVASAAPGGDNVIATATSQRPTDAVQAAELVKRELANQKVRAENRERKKRWREQNEDRNKDNDLRCRVNKRANRLFGMADNPNKRKWCQEEFAKRQRKRQEKERRKNTVNGSGAPGSGQDTGYQSPNAMASFTASQLEALQQQSSDYYPMSTNGIPPLSPTTATKLLNSNLAAVLKAGKNDPSATAAAAAAVLQSPQFLQLNQLLSQQTAEAAHYTSDMSTADGTNKSSDSILEQLTAAAAANAANSTSNEQATADAGEGTSGEAADKDKTQGEKPAENGKPANGQGGGDYPMDAVMTLMQLNAGWRQ
ncbi:unnamed protein product [Umbelopsis sp. WA50703]